MVCSLSHFISSSNKWHGFSKCTLSIIRYKEIWHVFARTIDGKLSCTVAFLLYPRWTATCFTFLKMLSLVVIYTHSHIQSYNTFIIHVIWEPGSYSNTHTHTPISFWKSWVKINFDFAKHTHFEKVTITRLPLYFQINVLKKKAKQTSSSIRDVFEKLSMANKWLNLKNF